MQDDDVAAGDMSAPEAFLVESSTDSRFITTTSGTRVLKKDLPAASCDVSLWYAENADVGHA